MLVVLPVDFLEVTCVAIRHVCEAVAIKKKPINILHNEADYDYETHRRGEIFQWCICKSISGTLVGDSRENSFLYSQSSLPETLTKAVRGGKRNCYRPEV